MKTEVLEKVQPTTNSLKGYKQTELGLIPVDWEVKKLEELCYVCGGGTPSTSVLDFWNGNINWFTPTEIGHSKYVSESSRKITKAGLENSSAKLLPIGAILLTTRATIGETSIILHEASTNQGFQSLIVKSQVNNEFVYYLIQTFKPNLIRNASGSTFLEISPQKVKSIQVAIPNFKEQTTIATALSDADALIRSLEQLIEKKKKIKQGAMQELLRPKEGWVRRKLGDECELITKGTTPTSIGRNFQLRGINFIKIESLAESGDIIDDKVAFIDEETHSLLKRSQIREGDLLFSIAGALGRVALVNLNLLPANTNQALAIIRLKPNSNIDVNYLYHYLKHEPIQNHILMINVQGAQANLSLRNIDEFQIEMPDLKSQIQISSILNLLEIQIFNLKMKLEKAQLIKQGMMQNLLTGKIRLI